MTWTNPVTGRVIKPSSVYRTKEVVLNQQLRHGLAIIAFRPITYNDMFFTALYGSPCRGSDIGRGMLIDNVEKPRFIVMHIIGQPNVEAWWE